MNRELALDDHTAAYQQHSPGEEAYSSTCSIAAAPRIEAGDTTPQRHRTSAAVKVLRIQPPFLPRRSAAGGCTPSAGAFKPRTAYVYHAFAPSRAVWTLTTPTAPNPSSMSNHPPPLASMLPRRSSRTTLLFGLGCALILTLYLGAQSDWAHVRMDRSTRRMSTLYDTLLDVMRSPRPIIHAEPGEAYHDDPALDVSALPLLEPGYEAWLPGLVLPSVFTSPSAPPGIHALARRLHAFLARPVLSHAAYLAPENAEWTEACPRELAARSDGSAFWEHSVTEERIREARAGIVMHLARMVEAGQEVVRPRAGGKKKRGLVMTGGNRDTTARLKTLLRILRNEYHSELPAEIFLFPDEMTDMNERAELEGLGARLVEVRSLQKATWEWKDFRIKGAAVTQNSFDEFLYLDSDNIPLRDPASLFDSHAYNAPGSGRAAFWPDLYKDHLENAIWRIMGDPCTLDLWTFESGQIVIDKTGNDGLNMAVLHIAAYMQAESKFWFEMCGGDKDTFRWAFRTLDLPFTVSPRWMSLMGSFDNDRFCGHTIVQYDLDKRPGEDRERPLFMHSNLLKLMSYEVSEGSAFSQVRRLNLDPADEKTLDHANMWVYNNRLMHMCTDAELRNNGEELTEAQRAVQKVVTIPANEDPLHAYEGFEDMYYRNGGRLGGWN